LSIARDLGNESLVARSLNRVGNWHVNLEEPHAGLPYHLEALGIVERLGDDVGIVETVDLIAMAHHCAGAEPDAAAYYARSVQLFTERDDRRGLANALALLALCGPSCHCAATTPCTSASVDDELRALRSVRMAREIGWRAGEAFARFLIADCLAWRGAYDRAIPLAREALALARDIDHLEWSAGSTRLLGVIAGALLAPAVSLDLLESAHAMASRLGSRVWFRWTAAPLAVARGRAGDMQSALDLLDAAFRIGHSAAAPERDTGAGSDSLTLGERQLWLAHAELALVRHEPVAALQIIDARLAAERRATPESVLGVPLLQLLRGQALAALERNHDALAALETARSEALAQHARPILWRIEVAIGHVHRSERRRVDARKAFDAARAIAAELTSTVLDEDLRESFTAGLTTAIPSGPSPSPERAAREALGGLTRRERDVAELVAHGKANRAIARELGIGERTVESYITSALAKLDFSSRTQLAAWAIERGIKR
jgi:DNA-binding CsgD family transcriptional regulator